jgi:ABC-type multidrug transport system permease subunit
MAQRARDGGTAIRWLLAKDLRILRRSPVMTGLLILYPVVIAVLIGLALSRGPGLPRVAFLNEIPSSEAVLTLGRTQIDTTKYEHQLFEAIDPVPVHTRAQALADVANGSVLAAVIVPADLPRRLASGDESAFIDAIYNNNALNESLVQDALNSKLAQANAELAVQLQKVADGYINLLLGGGRLTFLGTTFNVLGLEGTERVLDHTLTQIPRSSALYRELAPVAAFARIAVNNLGSSKLVIGAVAAPIVVRAQTIDGRRTPLDYYAVAVAVAATLLFVCVLLASGVVALEREEHTFERLRRGLVPVSALLAEKALLAALLGALLAFAMIAGIAIFVALDWGRAVLWLLALAGGGLAFATLGVALGAVVRDVRAASLLALLVSLPLMFLALVPPGTVAGGLYDVIRAISFVFPFKSGLEAIDAAINSSTPGIWIALVHLAALAAVFGVMARVGLRR